LLQEASEGLRPTAIGYLMYSGNFTDVTETMEKMNKGLRAIDCKFPIGGKIKTLPGHRPTDEMRTAHKEKISQLSGRLNSWYTQAWMTLVIEVDTSHS
jgi:hypothetical protein